MILTAYDDDQFVFGLLEAGAAGYLLKSVRGREIIEAVRQVYGGESVLHPAIARKVLNRFVPAPGKAAGQKLPEVLSEARAPLAAPSANRGGEPPALTAEEVVGTFGDAVDLVIDGGRVEDPRSTTIVSCIGGGAEIVRAGAVVPSDDELVAS